MTSHRTPARFALIASLTLVSGCGGNEVAPDTAEVIRLEPPKATTPEPAPPATPEASPAKDAPKG
jgi:hypothetical protein